MIEKWRHCETKIKKIALTHRPSKPLTLFPWKQFHRVHVEHACSPPVNGQVPLYYYRLDITLSNPLKTRGGIYDVKRAPWCRTSGCGGFDVNRDPEWHATDALSIMSMFYFGRDALFCLPRFSPPAGCESLFVAEHGALKDFLSPPSSLSLSGFLIGVHCARKPVCGLSWADGEDGGKAPQVEEEGTLRRCGSGD